MRGIFVRSSVVSSEQGLSSFRQTFVTIVATLLGLFFVLEAVGKALSFDAVESSVSMMTYVSPAFARIFSVSTIVLGLGAGIALMLRFRIKLVSILLFLVAAAHIWLWSAAIVGAKAIPKSWIGLAASGLSIQAVLLTYLFILNVCALLALISSPTVRVSPRGSLKAKLLLVASTILIAYMQLSFFLPIMSDSNRNTQLDLTPALSFADKSCPGFSSTAQSNKLLFLVRFSDFNCPPCFEDFITLSDSLADRFGNEARNRIAALFDVSDLPANYDSLWLSRWVESSGITFCAKLAPDALFTESGLTKSISAVVGAGGTVLFFGELPLGTEAHSDVLKLLAARR